MSTLFIDVWVTVYDHNGNQLDADNTLYKRVESAAEAAEVLTPLGVTHASVATPGPFIYPHGNSSRINFGSVDAYQNPATGSYETTSVSVQGAKRELVKLYNMIG